MKEFTAIPIFISLVETLSFSRAAIKLSVSKSAVSKRITQLENDLGVRLFYRTTRKISLTQEGEQFYDYVKKSYTIACDAKENIQQSKDNPTGTIKLNVPMAFGRLHLSSIIPDFLKKYPLLKIDVTLDDKVIDMVEGSYDLAINIGKLPDSNLIARPIVQCKVVMCASPEYLHKYGTPVIPEDLNSHNCIFYSYYLAGTKWSFSSKGKKVKITPKGNFVVNNSEVILDSLISGLGICQMPTFIVGKALKHNQLIPVLKHYHLPSHSIHAVYPERKFMPLKVTLFLEYMIKKIKQKQLHWDNY